MEIGIKNKQVVSTGLLITLMLLENACLYYFFNNGILSTGKNAIVLFLSSMLFGIVLIYKFYNVTIQDAAPRPFKNNIISYAMILLVITGLVMLGFQHDAFFRSHKLDHSSSDIIPVIQIMCRRFLNGQFPASPITDFGFTQEANYLPMHWMPYTIAELLHIDSRWVTYGAWSIAAVWLSIRSIKIPSPILRALAPLIIFASYYVLQSNNISILELTVEILISAYYIVLIISFNQKSGIFQGIIISFCLLSRYSLVFWMPLYCFILFVSNNRKQLYIATITAVIIVLGLYVIPFLSKDWGILYRSYKTYDAAAYFEWTHLNKDQQPLQLFHGTGIAYYFYTRFPNLDIMGKIKLLQRTDLICSVLVTILMGIWFWFKKDKINYKIFLIASFKIYLTVFLFLIQVPYGYLMCVANFVTIAIFCEQARYRVISKSTGSESQ